MTDFSYVYDGETIDFTHNGKVYTATTERDDHTGAPWEEHDGHGEVSEWTTRAKLPGELVLSGDGPSKRFYDFAGACRIARRDGWGYLPGKLEYKKLRNGWWRAECKGFDKAVHSRDVNAAIKGLYQAFRETVTAKQYAALAAMADFQTLRAWCNDEWFWCGVVVREKDACNCCGNTQSLWGVGSNAGAYLEDVARELAEELAAM